VYAELKVKTVYQHAVEDADELMHAWKMSDHFPADETSLTYG